MNRYESVIILSANASEEAMAAFGEKMKELISANGELTNVEEWGKKTFAYDIICTPCHCCDFIYKCTIILLHASNNQYYNLCLPWSRNVFTSLCYV